MGMFTVVVLHNDAIHAFQQNPKAFGEAILSGVENANMEGRQVDVPFDSYSNYLRVEPSRFTSGDSLFLASQGSFQALGSRDWNELIERNPECAKDFFTRAKDLFGWVKTAFDRAIKK